MKVGQVPHISFLFLLWTFPCRNCILLIKEYLHSSSYNSQSPVHCWCWANKKKPNSQWHLAVICASVYHCSSNSDSDFNNNNGSSLGYILKGRLVDVFSSQAGNNSHFSSLTVTFAASGLTEQTVHIKAECRCSCEASVSVLHLNPKSLLQHNTQAITWPQHGGRITYLMGLRCNHNQVTQHRLLSVQCTVHHFSTQVFFFFSKVFPYIALGLPPTNRTKRNKTFYLCYLPHLCALIVF